MGFQIFLIILNQKSIHNFYLIFILLLENCMLRVKDKREVYKVAINAAMGSFLFGYQMVNISSLAQLFRQVNQLT